MTRGNAAGVFLCNISEVKKINKTWYKLEEKVQSWVSGARQQQGQRKGENTDKTKYKSEKANSKTALVATLGISWNDINNIIKDLNKFVSLNKLECMTSTSCSYCNTPPSSNTQHKAVGQQRRHIILIC